MHEFYVYWEIIEIAFIKMLTIVISEIFAPYRYFLINSCSEWIDKVYELYSNVYTKDEIENMLEYAGADI